MSKYEIIEQLTDIVARQSKIIRDLCGAVSMLDASTSLDEETEKLQNNTTELLVALGFTDDENT